MTVTGGGMVAASDAVQAAQVAALGAVMVAVVGAIGTVLATRAARTAKQTAEAAKDAIGTPNGQGNVVQMVERLLERQAEIALALQLHTEQKAEALARMSDRIDTLRAEIAAANARNAARFEHIEHVLENQTGDLK